MAKKRNASLLAAQQEFFAKQGITPVHVEDKKKRKPTAVDDIDVSKIGLQAGNMGEYIRNINNREWLKKSLENARIK